jgi:hypothetical protein
MMEKANRYKDKSKTRKLESFRPTKTDKHNRPSLYVARKNKYIRIKSYGEYNKYFNKQK